MTLEPIPEESRRPEAELWAAFEARRPRILGALLDAVVVGLRRLPETHLPRLPRMADFALWATACETALWPAGTFWLAYSGNRDEAVEDVIDADPVAAAVSALMAVEAERTGTASELLAALAEAAGERIVKAKTWPESPRALAGRLRRAATFLRKIGIEISFKKEGRGRRRLICITTAPTPPAAENAGARPSASSAPSAPPANSNSGKGLGKSDTRTVSADADDSNVAEGPTVRPTVRANSLKARAADGADDADANSGLRELLWYRGAPACTIRRSRSSKPVAHPVRCEVVLMPAPQSAHSGDRDHLLNEPASGNGGGAAEAKAPV